MRDLEHRHRAAPEVGPREVDFQMPRGEILRRHPPGVAKERPRLLRQHKDPTRRLDAFPRLLHGKLAGGLEQWKQHRVVPLDLVKKRGQPRELRLELRRVGRRVLAREIPAHPLHNRPVSGA